MNLYLPHKVYLPLGARREITYLFLILCITYLTAGNFVMADGDNRNDSESTCKAHFVEAKSISFPLCKKGKNGTSISAVGVDYSDRITLFLKTREGAYYQHTLPLSVWDDFSPGFNEDDLYNGTGQPMTTVEAVRDLRGQFKWIGEKFGNIIGSHNIVMEQHFLRLVANCETNLFSTVGQGPRAAVLRYLDPNRVLTKNFSDDLPESVTEFLIYDTNSGDVLAKTSVNMHPYMVALRASLPLGKSGNYVILSERNLDRPVLFGVRLLQISPLMSIKNLVFPYENTFVTAISKPINESELKISLSEYPYMITCRLLSGADNVPDIEILEDCTPPVSPSCQNASDFQYFDPWVTWITKENSYMLHFWNPELGWYTLNLDPYTVYNDEYFPTYYYSTPASTLLLNQLKRNMPIYLLKPALPSNNPSSDY